ncbi:MAG: endonuclease V [Flavobacterium psychrophilum]|nr:MAG: endonuclease V [Flavobacterium psychrophilum]
MILAIDVHYRETYAKAVGVLFEWNDSKPRQTIIEYIYDIEEYIPGEFYKRELPCLLKIIEQVDLDSLEAIIVDGYIYVDNDFSLGLGGYLYQKLNEKVPVIGVAKTSFFTNRQTVIELLRGNSKNPLHISSVGYPLEDAVQKILEMDGEHRNPTILKELDKVTKDDTLDK